MIEDTSVSLLSESMPLIVEDENDKHDDDDGELWKPNCCKHQAPFWSSQGEGEDVQFINKFSKPRFRAALRKFKNVLCVFGHEQGVA